MPSFRYKGFPWTAHFFDRQLPGLPKVKPKVFSVFQTYSNLPEDQAAMALNKHVLPSVELANIPGGYGFTPGDRSVIQLNQIFVSELEEVLSKTPLPREDFHAPRDLEVSALLLLESTVLHELVHYYRLQTVDGARFNTMSARGRGVEEAFADQFEKEAYGYEFHLHDSFVKRCMPKTAVSVKLKKK